MGKALEHGFPHTSPEREHLITPPSTEPPGGVILDSLSLTTGVGDSGPNSFVLKGTYKRSVGWGWGQGDNRHIGQRFLA